MKSTNHTTSVKNGTSKLSSSTPTALLRTKSGIGQCHCSSCLISVPPAVKKYDDHYTCDILSSSPSRAMMILKKRLERKN